MNRLVFIVVFQVMLSLFVGCGEENTGFVPEELSSDCGDVSDGSITYDAITKRLFACVDGEMLPVENVTDTVYSIDTVHSIDTIHFVDTLYVEQKPPLGTGILDFHPDEVMIPKLENLVHQKRDEHFRVRAQQIVLLHITDIHGDQRNLARVEEFRSHYSKYIDEVVHTGDAVQNRWVDGYDFWSAAGADKYLFVLGDHDIKFKDWSNNDVPVTQQDVYARYMAPFVDGWNAIQPDNAANEALMYYYKDVDKGEGLERAKLRMIALDDYHWDNKQADWLVAVLDDALAKDFAVIIFTHEGHAVTKYENSSFASLEKFGDPDEILEAQIAVDEFMNKGGEFVMWVSGDAHQDDIGVLKNYPRQIAYRGEISGINSAEWSDGWRKRGTITQDCFTLISIDRFEKVVRFLRIGSHVDRYQREKESMSINYATTKMIASD